MNYVKFLNILDSKLKEYFDSHRDYICCKAGCSGCCEKGDYPLSQYELEYMMLGYTSLDNLSKNNIQQNIKNMVKGGACPFLIDKKCSIYNYRPIICRVFGLSYISRNNVVKLPYCVDCGKNYSKVYINGEILYEPIKVNLDTTHLLKGSDCGEIRNLYDWLHL